VIYGPIVVSFLGRECRWARPNKRAEMRARKQIAPGAAQVEKGEIGNLRVAVSRTMLYCMRNQEVAYEHQ